MVGYSVVVDVSPYMILDGYSHATQKILLTINSD